MCGRISLSKDPNEIAERFHVNSMALEEFRPRYNIPPGTKTPIIIATAKGRRLETGFWGIKSKWPKPITCLTAEKLLYGSYTKQLATQRCIIPVDGFYEWGEINKKKTQAWFGIKSRGLFGMPALFNESEIKPFTIFTLKPNTLVGKIHERMPAILKPAIEDKWLDTSITDLPTLHKMLIQYPPTEMIGHQVSKALNIRGAEGPELIEAIAPL
jgi:putative SOS response-associated peptidase YedK